MNDKNKKLLLLGLGAAAIGYFYLKNKAAKAAPAPKTVTTRIVRPGPVNQRPIKVFVNPGRKP